MRARGLTGLGALAAVLGGLIGAAGARGQANDSLFVVVRVDDVQSRSAITPRALGPFEAAVEARGAKVTWLVIPGRLAESQNADGVLAAALRASMGRGHEVALHGYTHICPRCGGTDHELWCARDRVAHSAAVQTQRLDAGLALLRERLGADRVRTFVAPGHQADATTYRLLAARGVSVVSTHAAAEDSLSRDQTNLRTSDDFAWSLSSSAYAARRADALRDARTRGRAEGVYVLLLHDPFTRPGYDGGITIRWVGEVLDSLRAAPGVRFGTMAEAAAWQSRRAVAADAPAAPPALAVTVAPQPAAGRVAFRLALPAAGPVTLDVFDALGRRVARVLGGPHPPGPLTATWDASGLPAGPYAYRLAAGPHVRTGVLVIAR